MLHNWILLRIFVCSIKIICFYFLKHNLNLLLLLYNHLAPLFFTSLSKTDIHLQFIQNLFIYPPSFKFIFSMASFILIPPHNIIHFNRNSHFYLTKLIDFLIFPFLIKLLLLILFKKKFRKYKHFKSL